MQFAFPDAIVIPTLTDEVCLKKISLQIEKKIPSNYFQVLIRIFCNQSIFFLAKKELPKMPRRGGSVNR